MIQNMFLYVSSDNRKGTKSLVLSSLNSDELKSNSIIKYELLKEFINFNETELNLTLKKVKKDNRTLIINNVNEEELVKNNFLNSLINFISPSELVISNSKFILCNPVNSIEKVTIGEKSNIILNINLIPKLKILSFISHKTFKGNIIGNSNSLNHIIVWYYNPKNKKLDSLLFAPNIEQLEINHTNIENLDGIDFFRNLTSITINMGRNLKKIEKIKFCKKLTRVFIHNCKKVEDWYVIENLSNVKELNLCNNGSLGNINIYRLKKLNDFIHYKSNIEGKPPIVFTDILKKALNDKSGNASNWDIKKDG